MTRHITLAQARAEWNTMITGDGGRCPCCNRWGRIYVRHLNVSMCKAVVWLNKQQLKNGWVDIPQRAPKWLLRTNQLATMRWWDLIERKPSEDPAKKHSGLWRVTEQGDRFALGLMRKRRSVLTYDGHVVDRTGPLLRISDVIEDFDYSQVMS
jgi:hypothetical protein